MKAFRAVSLLLALIFLLNLGACTLLPKPTEPETPSTVPEETETVPVTDETEPLETEPVTEPPVTVSAYADTPHPVDENFIYYSNDAEYYRLYRIRKDGSGNTLVYDAGVNSVYREGETVYFLRNDDGALVRLNITTGTEEVLKEHVYRYAVEGSDLVYAKTPSMEDAMEPAPRICYLDLNTGDDNEISGANTYQFFLSAGYCYFVTSDYGMDENSEHLVAANLHEQSTLELDRTPTLFDSLYPVPGGIYYREGNEYLDTGFTWKFARSDGSGMETLPAFLPANAQLFYVSESRFLYLAVNEYADTEMLHSVDAQANDNVLAMAPKNGWLNARPLSGSEWLLESESQHQWGDANWSRRVTYTYLDGEAGTMTLLNTVGGAGALFAGGDFPVIDSSTARKPVTDELYRYFVANRGYEGKEPLCSTTHGAWTNMADKVCDFALLAAPTAEEQAYLDEKGVQVEMKLYGGDGLCFIGHTNNPVTDLTEEQIIGIYTGKITNWKELGGPDHPITVLYRDDQSGSQRLFESLVLKDNTMPAGNETSENFLRLDEMSTLVNAVLYEPWSVGYSIMTYLDSVYAEADLKVFTVNGVLPSPETVMDRSYPYNTHGYAVIRADEAADSPARRLYDWFGSPIADEILISAGVSPLKEN